MGHSLFGSKFGWKKTDKNIYADQQKEIVQRSVMQSNTYIKKHVIKTVTRPTKFKLKIWTFMDGILKTSTLWWFIKM